MKKLIVLIFLLVAIPVIAANQFDGTQDYSFEDFTGGTDADLDGVDTTNLADGYTATVYSGSNAYFYVLDIDSSATESSPDIIEPDSGPGAWILYGSSGVSYKSLHINHTAWPNGLSNEEIYPIHVAAGQTFSLYQLDVDIKGGGSDTDLTVIVYNETTLANVATETADDTDNTGSPLATVSGAAELSIRITNATGSTADAAITVVWSVQ